MHGTARAVPVFDSDGCSLERGFSVLVLLQQVGTVPVPASVPEKQFRAKMRQKKKLKRIL